MFHSDAACQSPETLKKDIELQSGCSTSSLLLRHSAAQSDSAVNVCSANFALGPLKLKFSKQL
jgi:hypothetical protein